MSPLAKILIITGIALFSPARISFAQDGGERGIRVGLVAGAQSVKISAEWKYSLCDVSLCATTTIEPHNDYLVKAKGAAIEFDGRAYSSPIRLVAESGLERIRVNGKRYRGTILITAGKGGVTVVDDLGIEEYLYGILPTEANPAWSPESLKAQAVVSRTYALRNLKRHDRDGFDICTQTHCQVYGGLECEDERSNRAVDDTKGEVLIFKGELAQALFHASCGGYTENPNNVWNWESATPKYLAGRSDKYCSNSPHNVWKNRIAAGTIQSKLKQAGYSVGIITKIKISGYSRSGRAKFLKIVHSGGTILIPASKFRMAVDTWLIKSTLFKDIARRGNAFEFSGRGWGHGVGLCQWGAKGMAEKGKDYKEILEYFYPGTDVEQTHE
jgi:stage II sporulation protein D